MANVGSTNQSRSPGARIAGPRRVVRLAATPPPPLPVVTASATAPEANVVLDAAIAAEPPTLRNLAIDLPSLDYDEPTTRRPTVSPTHAARLVGDRRRPSTHDAAPAVPRARSMRWFAVGLMVGVLAVTFAHGDAKLGVRTARLWGANTLRSMKKTQEPARVQSAALVATSSHIEAPPCSLTDDDCAILMAPFIQAEAEATVAANEIPLVDVDSLPKWKPPVVVTYVAPPPKPLIIVSAPVAQPDVPSAAGGTPPVDEPAPKPSKRAPGPFDAPPPIDGPGAMASAPTP